MAVILSLLMILAGHSAWGLPWQDSQAMPPWAWLKRKSWPGFSAKRWLAAMKGRGRRVVGIIGLLADKVGPQVVEGVAGMAGLALGHVHPGPPLGTGGGQIDHQARVVDVREVGIDESRLPQLRGEAAHRQQFAVAALALHAVDRHDAAQTLGVVAGMAIVALLHPASRNGDDVRMPSIIGQAVPWCLCMARER